MKNFVAPIPGMSLTKEPRNTPWEQPPLYSKPEEALGFYFKKFEDEDTLDDTLFLLEQGFPLSTFIDSTTSYGVMEGYHSFDVKLLISPLLHEHFVELCKALDIDVVEDAGPTKAEKMKERDKKRISILLEKALDEPEEVSELSKSVAKAKEELAESAPSEEAPAPLIPRRG